MSGNLTYERIWKTVNTIPSGKVSSYGQIADFAGLPGRARLVGKSLAYVPNTLNVNWHRVVCSDGQLAFTKSSEQALKQTGLLLAEGVVVINNRVKMKKFNWVPDLATMLQGFSY
ncbi:MAG: methylated-DNA-protein-cysteine methyltransferase-like protein [Kangiellaceae bacterium]|jgi:methylated-DNA-protein-cysteine methyltransferase-like protein